MRLQSWTAAELRAELERYRRELEEAGLTKSTVDTYVDRASRFLRWLDGDYRPGN
jgi:hypothetical protein